MEMNISGRFASFPTSVVNASMSAGGLHMKAEKVGAETLLSGFGAGSDLNQSSCMD